MIWLTLLRSPLAWGAIVLIAVGSYAAVQRLAFKNCQAEFAKFRADTERLGAEARVQAAQEAAGHAQHAQEVLSDLQTRYDALGARYASLRRTRATGGGVPALSSAASSLSACPGDALKPDAVAGRLERLEGGILEVLERGDKELAKYRELWELQQKNTKRSH